MNYVTVTISEEHRQMLVLALAKLSLERPGWYMTLGELAALYSTAPQIEDGRALFESFREIHARTTADEEARLAAIGAADDDRERARLIREYWQDGDRADRTPRPWAYLHLGLLSGVIDRLLDEAGEARDGV